MKCRVCGSLTRVTETRKAGEGYVLRRTRVCSRDRRHRYTTYEVDDKLNDTVVKMALSPARIGGFIARALQYDRNVEIVGRLARGEKQEVLAVEYGLTPSMISHIKSRMHRGQDGTA